MTAIDLFAGLGGFTEAASLAGVRVAWAANHWQAAVDCHRINHPDVAHVCQDLHQANWEAVPSHDLLLASPCCQGHSRARGKDRPHSDLSRSTAWAVVSCAEYHRPAALIVENVPDFLKWALFPAWRLAIEALGYALSINVRDVADSGVPQNRPRVFIVGTRSKHSLTLTLPRRVHAPASTIIEWGVGRWSEVDRPGRAAATLARILSARQRFGDRFLMPYYGSGSGLTGRSLDRPVGTITTRDRWAIVDGDRMRMFLPTECRAAMGFSAQYVLPSHNRTAIHLLGNAVPPPAAADVIAKVMVAA